MDNNKFTQVIESRLNSLKELLIKKGAEYATSEDRLHNFKRGSEVTGDHPVKVLDGFLLKHYVSYRDLLKDLASGKSVKYEYLNEKVGDILAYFLIFEALVIDTGEVENLPPALDPYTELYGEYDTKLK